MLYQVQLHELVFQDNFYRKLCRFSFFVQGNSQVLWYRRTRIHRSRRIFQNLYGMIFK
jgi:hypothetical protein